MPQRKLPVTAKVSDTWAARWEQALKATIVPVRPQGEGWKCTQELQQEWGVSRQAVSDRMGRLIRRGVIEKALGRNMNAKTNYYRPVVRP